MQTILINVLNDKARQRMGIGIPSLALRNKTQEILPALPISKISQLMI